MSQLVHAYYHSSDDQLRSKLKKFCLNLNGLSNSNYYNGESQNASEFLFNLLEYYGNTPTIMDIEGILTNSKTDSFDLFKFILLPDFEGDLDIEEMLRDQSTNRFYHLPDNLIILPSFDETKSLNVNENLNLSTCRHRKSFTLASAVFHVKGSPCDHYIAIRRDTYDSNFYLFDDLLVTEIIDSELDNILEKYTPIITIYKLMYSEKLDITELTNEKSFSKKEKAAGIPWATEHSTGPRDILIQDIGRQIGTHRKPIYPEFSIFNIEPEEKPEKATSKLDKYRLNLQIERLRKVLTGFERLKKTRKKPFKKSAFKKVLAAESFTAEPHSKKPIRLMVDTKDDDYYSFDCDRGTLGMNYIASGVIRSDDFALMFSNLTNEVVNINKGTRLGTGRRIPGNCLPEIDDLRSEFKIEIIKRANDQFRADRELEENGWSREDIVKRRTLDLQTLKPQDKVVEVLLLGDETTTIVEAPLESPLLPREQSKKDFKKILDGLPVKIREVLVNYEETFLKENPGEPFTFMNCEPVTVRIREDCPDILTPDYQKKCSPEEQTFLNEWVQLNHQSGLIRRSNSNYTSPLLMVPKRDKPGVYRIVIDVRKVNKMVLETPTYPMPTMDEAFVYLPNMNYFATLDATSAFNRIKCGNAQYSAFYINDGPYRGKWQFNSICQGWSVSPAIFTEKIQELLADLPGVTDTFEVDHDLDKGGSVFTTTSKIISKQKSKIFPYLDDIVVGSWDLDTHCKDLNMLLSRVKTANLKLDINKSSFAMTTVNFLGLEIGSGAMRTSPDRTRDLFDRVKCPNLLSKAIKPWQKLFGLLGYYRRFIDHFAEKESIVKSIRDECLEKMDKSFAKEKVEEVDTILKGMAEEVVSNVLAVPDPDTNLMLMVDASDRSLGGVLQTDARKPILFIGRMFRDGEKSMSIFEKELLSVLFGIRKAEHYIKRSKETKVLSDNKSSVINLTSYNPVTVSGRAVRMIIEIQTRIANSENKINFSHIQGIQNIVADCLSRLEPTRDHSLNMLGFTRAQENYKTQLTKLHDQTHQGVMKLILLGKEQGLKAPANAAKIAEQVVTACQLCKGDRRLAPKTTVGATSTPAKEMTTLHIDHVHYGVRSAFGNRYIFTALLGWLGHQKCGVLDVLHLKIRYPLYKFDPIICHKSGNFKIFNHPTVSCPFSKFFLTSPTKTLSMDEIQPILSLILTQHRSIRNLKADNAFNNGWLKEICRIHEVNLYFTSSHNSRSNNVERYHRTMRESLQKQMELGGLGPDDWETGLVRVNQVMNMTPNLITGYSPHMLLYGEAPALIEGQTSDEILSTSRAETRLLVKDRIERSKSRYTSLPKDFTVKPGTVVTVRYSPRSVPFSAAIIEDGPLSALVERCDYVGKDKFIKISKRHIFVNKFVDGETAEPTEQSENGGQMQDTEEH